MAVKVNAIARRTGYAGARVKQPARIPSDRTLSLAELIAKSVRNKPAPLARQFVRGTDGAIPPMVLCLRGGRGGEVRLKFLLSIIWKARKSPYDAQYPARAWAELLGLDDPEQSGARRIADAITWLAQANLLSVEQLPGRPSIVYLRDGAGTGTAYQPPYKLKQPYVQIPVSFWTKGWVSVLSGSAVALFLVMLDQSLFSDSGKPFWLSPSKAKEWYALSPDTWTRASAELQDFGLIEVIRKPVSPDFGWRRLRNTFRLHLERMDLSPS